MSAYALVLKWKRAWFESIRTRKLTRLLQDLDNHLTNVEILYGPPSGPGPVLVLSPHPDDESIGCGGTLALLARQGIPVDVAFLTSGNLAGDAAYAAVREEECRQAARLLDVRELIFLHAQDGELHLQPWLFTPVADLIEKGQYRIVFCPWPYDGHSDHSALFRILQQALARLTVAPAVWLYEVWAPLMANRLVDIDAVLDVKRQAIDCHRSQVQDIDYTGKFLALASYRSLNCRPAKHAEAFLVCTPAMIAKIGT